MGAGHVGLVSAACLSAVGHDVTALDIDEDRLARLRAGESPFFEPHLDDLLARAGDSRPIAFTSDPAAALDGAEIAFLCVPTPNDDDDDVDLRAVLAAARSVAQNADPGTVVVNRSTAPVGTAAHLRTVIERVRGAALPVAVNPEFLAQGSAVRDFLFPDRILIGAWEPVAAECLRRAYEPITASRVAPDIAEAVGVSDARPIPMVETEPPTAELVKYAANAFLAMKISFINEVSLIAEQVGADVTQVAKAVGLDHRIGPDFLRAGIGWGGSCFPKDIQALTGMAESRGVNARLLRAANDVNQDQHRWVRRQLEAHFGPALAGRTVGLLGLTFKPDTDDLRSSPAVEIALELAGAGMTVRAYDPIVQTLPAHLSGIVELAPDPGALADGADALVLATDWPQFRDLDLVGLAVAMRGGLFLDGRNLLDPARAREAGLVYVGVGRASPGEGLVSLNGHSSPGSASLSEPEVALSHCRPA